QITAVYFAQFFFQISVAAAGVDDYLSTFFIGIAGRSKAHAHSKRLAFAINTGAAEFKTLVAVLLQGFQKLFELALRGGIEHIHNGHAFQIFRRWVTK